MSKDIERMSIEVSASTRQVTITTPPGDVVVIHGERMSGYVEELAHVSLEAMLFGLARKVANCAAISKDTATGLPASWTVKLAAMREECERLESGTTEWNSRSTAGRVVGADMALLIAAYMELKNVDRAGAAAWCKLRSPEERAALMLNPRVKVIVDRLRTQLASDVDSDALLDEVM